jgi:hypothetical protein
MGGLAEAGGFFERGQMKYSFLKMMSICIVLSAIAVFVKAVTGFEYMYQIYTGVLLAGYFE